MKRLSKLEGMDLMLLKVIIMLLTVSFLEFILSAGIGTLTWPTLVIPVTIIALAAALRWMQSGSDDEDSESSTEASRTPKQAADSYLDELERLAALHGQGALSDEEFQTRKETIMQT